MSPCAPLLGLGDAARATEMPDESRVKREAVFEFAQKPAVTRDGDKITIRFATKAMCDVTVAIEDAPAAGSSATWRAGCSGPKAPSRSRRTPASRRWCGTARTTRASMLDNKDSHGRPRLAGPEPRYQKTLFWEPKKRVSVGGAGSILAEDVIVGRAEGV